MSVAVRPDSRPLSREPAYTSVAGAARYCSVSVQTIRRAILDGRLRSHRVGRRVVVAFADLDRFVQGSESPR